MQPQTPCGMGLRGTNKEFYHVATYLMYWHRSDGIWSGLSSRSLQSCIRSCSRQAPCPLKLGFAIWLVCLAVLIDLCREVVGLTSGLRVERSLQEFSRAGTSQEFVCFYHHAPARQHHIGHARNLNSLEHGVIDAHVVSLRTDGVLPVRIEDHEIRVTAHRDRALAWIQAKEFCRSRGNQFHETVYAESSLRNAAEINKAHAVLDSRTTVRDLSEIVAAQF